MHECKKYCKKTNQPGWYTFHISGNRNKRKSLLRGLASTSVQCVPGDNGLRSVIGLVCAPASSSRARHGFQVVKQNTAMSQQQTSSLHDMPPVLSCLTWHCSCLVPGSKFPSVSKQNMRLEEIVTTENYLIILPTVYTATLHNSIVITWFHMQSCVDITMFTRQLYYVICTHTQLSVGIHEGFIP